MRHSIFSSSNRTQLSLLCQSLKKEQKEVSSLFHLTVDRTDFDDLLKLSALRAKHCEDILQNYALLFQIKNEDFNANITSIAEIHKNLLAEKSRLSGHLHLQNFSKKLQACLSLIEVLFKGKLDTNPKNNLMTRYLNNLKNALGHLQTMILLVKSFAYSETEEALCYSHKKTTGIEHGPRFV